MAAINNVLSALAQKMGLQATRLDDLRAMQDRLEDDIRRNQDQLGALKKSVADIDAQLQAKKKEYDAAGPGIRKIIKSEFAILFKRQDQILEKRDSIFGRLEKDTIILHKLKLEIDTMANPPHTDMVEEIADELGDALTDLQMEDDSVSRLSDVTFSKQPDVSEERIDAIGTPTAETSGEAKSQQPDELDRMISEIG